MGTSDAGHSQALEMWGIPNIVFPPELGKIRFIPPCIRIRMFLCIRGRGGGVLPQGAETVPISHLLHPLPTRMPPMQPVSSGCLELVSVSIARMGGRSAWCQPESIICKPPGSSRHGEKGEDGAGPARSQQACPCLSPIRCVACGEPGHPLTASLPQAPAVQAAGVERAARPSTKRAPLSASATTSATLLS